MMVDIWYEDDVGNWMLIRSDVKPLGDIPAEIVAKKICEINGWASASIEPVSMRKEYEAA